MSYIAFLKYFNSLTKRNGVLGILCLNILLQLQKDEFSIMFCEDIY